MSAEAAGLQKYLQVGDISHGVVVGGVGFVVWWVGGLKTVDIEWRG